MLVIILQQSSEATVGGVFFVLIGILLGLSIRYFYKKYSKK